NFRAAQLGSTVFAQAREVVAVEEYGAARRDVQAGEQAKQRRLSASRWPNDRDERAVGYDEADVAQHGEAVVAALVFLGQLSSFEHDRVERDIRAGRAGVFT